MHTDKNTVGRLHMIRTMGRLTEIPFLRTEKPEVEDYMA